MRRLILETSDLLTAVRLWKPEPCTAPEPYASYADDVNELWRQALLCHIYHDVCGVSSSDSRMKACVDDAIEALRNLTWVQSVMWPVFMVGLHAFNIEDRELITDRLTSMNTAANFTSPTSVLDFLQKVWQDLDESDTGNSRWKELMAESGTELHLML